MKRAKSSTAAATLANTVDGQCYISEDKKSVITKTKTTPRGKFLPKRAKQASSNGTAEQADNNDSNEDSNEISGDEKSETEAADIQRISEKIVQEIERSFDNGGGVFGSDLNNGSDKFVGGKGKGCFSSFIKPDCRKLIESLMRRQNSDANTDSTQPTVCEEEEDTCDSHSVDLSEDDECEHDHDSCSTQSGDGDNRDRYSRCDCCYCTYLSGDTPSRHDGRRNEEIRERLRKVLKKREKQWDADRGHSLSSDVRDRVSEAETKVEIKNDVVEERSLEELLQFINEKTPADAQLSSSKAAKKARQKQRKLEEKKRAEEEDCAKRKALEEEKAKKEAELAAENAKKIQEEKSKSKRRQKQKQQAEAEMKKVAVRDLSDSAITEDTSKDKDQMFSANAANKARQQQKKLEEKKKHEEERQRKLADERQRQEAIKKEKAEKEARLQDEKRKRLEEQRQAKLEKRLEKVEKNKAEKEKSRNVVQAKLGQSKDIITEHKEIASEQTTDEQLGVSNQLVDGKIAVLNSGVDVSSVPSSYMNASSSYFLSHGAESSGQSLPHLAVPGMEGSEDMQYLRQHASLIAATAAANGHLCRLYHRFLLSSNSNTLLPLSSATSVAAAIPINPINYSNNSLLNPGFSTPVHSTSLPSSRYGAIGEKLPQRKTFNQYAAYDRETNHILGISQPCFTPFVTSNMTSGASSNPVLKQEAARFCAVENTLSTTAISNNQPFQDSDCVNLDVTNRNSHVGQQQIGDHFSSSPSLFVEKIGCAAVGSSSIWSHDDAAKRFVEQEECSIFKFSEC
uniref:Uncharacterized protein n=1 Tax=Ditylenchus dipsaci TaxID=166011 RepID=A0A915E8Q5_9BILA